MDEHRDTAVSALQAAGEEQFGFKAASVSLWGRGQILLIWLNTSVLLILFHFLFNSGVFGVGGKHTLGNKCYCGTMTASSPAGISTLDSQTGLKKKI